MIKYKDFFKEDVLPGGKGDNTPLQTIDPRELGMGIKVEMEHTHDENLAKEIATDHLSEDPHYYTRLKQAGLADELEDNPQRSEKAVVEPDTNKVDKQTTPGTVFPEVPNDPSKGPDMCGCIGNTKGMNPKSEVDNQPKDPEPTDHITGAMGSTPRNPNILPKQTGIEEPEIKIGGDSMMQTMMKSIVPQDISIDIAEGKSILNKMKKDSKNSPTVKGSATAFSPKEGFVPAAGNPDTDKKFVKGKRWTVKW